MAFAALQIHSLLVTRPSAGLPTAHRAARRWHPACLNCSCGRAPRWSASSCCTTPTCTRATCSASWQHGSPDGCMSPWMATASGARLGAVQAHGIPVRLTYLVNHPAAFCTHATAIQEQETWWSICSVMLANAAFNWPSRANHSAELCQMCMLLSNAQDCSMAYLTISALVATDTVLGPACRGLEGVAAAQDCLHSGQSVGKLYVQLASDLPARARSRM